MSERDTPILCYPGVGTWHPIHTILVPERDTRSPNLILSVHQAFFYTKASSLTKRFQSLGFYSLIMLIHYNYLIISRKHTIKHIEDFTKLPNTYHSLLRVSLRNSINHNLPPPKNWSQEIYFSNALLSSSFLPLSFVRPSLSLFLNMINTNQIFKNVRIKYKYPMNMIHWIKTLLQ